MRTETRYCVELDVGTGTMATGGNQSNGWVIMEMLNQRSMNRRKSIVIRGGEGRGGNRRGMRMQFRWIMDGEMQCQGIAESSMREGNRRSRDPRCLWHVDDRQSAKGYE
jgi:hypothetical protein